MGFRRAVIALLIAFGASNVLAAESMLELVATIPLPQVKGRIDHLAVDVKGHRLFAIADVALAGHPESFQLEGVDSRAFVNVPSARHVAVVDLAKRAVVA